ncbi:hypothetical protein PHLCEN_2v13564 [Hermanssonia centrifuga]|uniref:Uncharacterized protein n=1 Tax=Hermanssonia centrifuga TaxID=98765 RepID=A0A2R6NDU0_9APHY|nr:hypothetical protein PHLCEN_2v13564 [Hermanssonia centrifuga]
MYYLLLVCFTIFENTARFKHMAYIALKRPLLLGELHHLDCALLSTGAVTRVALISQQAMSND